MFIAIISLTIIIKYQIFAPHSLPPPPKEAVLFFSKIQYSYGQIFSIFILNFWYNNNESVVEIQSRLKMSV